MIERVLIKDYLSFKDVELEFKSGLVAFTGPSGAGKSILVEALLTLFGLKDANAKLVEASINLPFPKLEKFGISDEEPNVLKYLKEKNARYFINSQALSKKNMQDICSHKIRYLSLREDDEFASESMINLLDTMIGKKDKSYKKTLTSYEKSFEKYISVKDELEKMLEEERRIDELSEFARYEVKTIDEIDPKVGEDEELMKIKKSLSKKEKILQSIEEADKIFEYESAVSQMLSLCEIDSSFFDECMNELRASMEEGSLKVEQLEEMDIEALLERIEQLSKLKTRFGSIENTLKYREKKQKELQRYENLAFEKESLQKEFNALDEEIKTKSGELSKKRKASLGILENLINEYLKKLYLNNANIVQNECEYNQQGRDSLHVNLNNVDLKRISSGELNRIRLAFIATKNEVESGGERGILVLDEVDANLSGKEAMSVANVLKSISKSYQVLAISHQPQLSSSANCHFLVEKKDGKSTVKLLNKKERIDELARMVSGEEIKPEAVEFAKKLLEGNGF